MHAVPETVKHCINCGGAVAGVTTLLGYLPEVLGALVSVLAIGWYCLQFWNHFKGRGHERSGH